MIEFEVSHLDGGAVIGIKGSRYKNHHIFYFNKPLMFVNIMKNASTSIGEVIYDQAGAIDQPQDNLWFTIVRDPLKRFLSTMNMLEGFTDFDANTIGQYLRHYPEHASQDVLDWFMHFTPQRLVIQNYQSQPDMKFYSIENLEPLKRDLKRISSKEVHIPHLNKSKRSTSIQKWIDANRNFIDKFLEKDYEWYNSLKIEK